MTTAGSTGRLNDGQESPGFDRSLLVELAHGRLTPEESIRVLAMAEADLELSRELDLVILMMEEGARIGGTRGTSYPPGDESGPSLRESAPLTMRMLRVAAVVLALLGGGWVLDSVTALPFSEIARVDIPDLHLRVRDGSSDVLDGARAFLYDGNWRECARRAEWYLSVSPQGDERAQALILTSAAHLMGARTHILGFHVRYDQSQVDSARGALREARACARTLLENEEIDWFEAKASLMTGDHARARECLEAIVNEGGARLDAARAILSQLPAAHP